MLTKDEALEFKRMLKFEIEHSDNTTISKDVEIVLDFFTEKVKIEKILEIGPLTDFHLRNKINEIIDAINLITSYGDNNNE